MAKLVSVIVTVLNEEKTILQLLESLLVQTYPIYEVIIADGGSKDKTETIIQDFQKKHKSFPLTLIGVSGNRSVGRNAAIQKASTKVIAITDAGCEPHHDWLEELMACYEIHKTRDNERLVIAGYYDAKAKTPFEEAVVPYVLVMPDRVNPNNFLPATRSVLLEKKVWEVVGKFNEALRWNEDYDFAQKLVKEHIKIVFAEKAKVTWFPRENLAQFWKMIFHFAQGDAQAGIWRKKVIFIFARYIFAFFFLLYLVALGELKTIIAVIVIGYGLYGFWAILKNLRYVRNGTFWLPILQITSDFAVIAGSLAGLVY